MFIQKHRSWMTVVRWITLIFGALSAAYLVAGGIWLVALGGSVYYLIAGLVFAAFVWLFILRRASALAIYALLLFGTAIWAVQEAGFDFWALAPRADVLVIFGVWLALATMGQFETRRRPANTALIASLVVWGGVLAYAGFHDPQELHGTLPANDEAQRVPTPGVANADWPAYGRTQAGTRYSPLTQITPDNAKRLTLAWSFETGDRKGPQDPVEITDEVTPIKIGRLLYLCSPHQILFALDAQSGALKWKFDPGLKPDPSFQHVTCRGVSYVDVAADGTSNGAPKGTSGTGSSNSPDNAVSASVDSASAAAAASNAASAPTAASAPVNADVVSASSAACTRRIYLPVNNGHLYALDAQTGQRCSGFANNGDLDLQSGQPVTTAGMYEPTSPPIVTRNMIVVAGAVEDNYSSREPSGVIRGYDVQTGALRWVFDPGVKNPNENPPASGHYSYNSPNSWAPAAYDPKLDLVYLPMGVTTPDIWGGHRTPDEERFASGLLALNASTGKLAWFYQSVHHDLWDMDQPSQPTLVDLRDSRGNVVPVVYAPAKTGNLFVLDRRTGATVVPAPEQPVPQGAAPGDHVSATQPFSALTFRPSKRLTDADMWGATMYDQLVCRVMFHQLRYEGTFTPPSVQGTLVFPGNLGMFEWGGIAVDTDRRIAIANPIALPFVSRLVPRGPHNPIEPASGASGGGTETGVQPQYGVPFGVTLNAFLSPFGLPCKQPAWGYLAAIDLDTNQIVWKRRIGTVRDSSPIPLPFRLGMPMLGGPMVTAGGVAFIGATADNYLRAFNVDTGKPIWQARLPAGGQATPMTYAIDGRQYVVIAAGGHGSFGTKLGDYVMAYALPTN